MPTRGGEASVDETVEREAKKRGWWAIKMTALRIAGMPDWFVLIRGGRIGIIECKAPEGRRSPIQKFVHERLQNLGFVVPVPRSANDVKTIFAGWDK